MAVALKSRYFNSANDLSVWVANAANNVGGITSITFDAASGKYVLFYTSL